MSLIFYLMLALGFLLVAKGVIAVVKRKTTLLGSRGYSRLLIRFFTGSAKSQLTVHGDKAVITGLIHISFGTFLIYLSVSNLQHL